MSRTQYFVAASLDGYIATADDDLGWLTGYEGSYEGPGADSARMGGYDAFYEEVGALVMGSTTYEWALAEVDTWPYDGKPTWVLSTRELRQPPGGEVRVVDAEVGDLHEEMLAAAGGKNLWVVGGGNVASQYADEGLLDDLILTVVPVALGQGKPLFDRAPPGGPMQLVDARPFTTGMVQLRYELTTPG